MKELMRPTLLSSCALAATTAEARFRVNYPNSLTRTSRIFALDDAAANAMVTIAEAPWNGAHFLSVGETGSIDPDSTKADDLPLISPDGSPARLSLEIEGADVVVMLATSNNNLGVAEVIAREAYERKIMIAALALSNGLSNSVSDKVVAALRPFASVLVVASDNDFIPAMLSALRA